MAFALIRIPSVGFGDRQPLARIFDQAGARRNEPRCKRTEPLNRGRANLEPCIGQRRYLFFSTSVMPPEMMYAITSGASASIRVTDDAGTTRMCPANP